MLIVLDTNVVSELMKPEPDAIVFAWAARQPAAMVTTSITEAEILYGIALLPSSRRKTDLAAVAARMFRDDFKDRVLAFDSAAAPHYGEILARRHRAGRPVKTLDAQIAAIAVAADAAAIATRNTTDFENCGVAIVNPWTELS